MELTSSTLVFALLFASTCSVLTFWFSHTQRRKEVDSIKDQLRTFESQNEMLAAQVSDLNERSSSLEQKWRNTELSEQKAVTEVSSLNERKLELESELKALNLKYEQHVDDKHQAEKQTESYLSELKELRKQLQSIEERHANTIQESESLKTELSREKAAYAELRTTLEEKQASHKREMERFNEQKEELKKDFENLANRIFEEKGKSFTQTSQQSIDTLLKPFRDQIEGFQKRVNDIHDESIKGNTNLNAEIKKVLDIGLKMSDEASNLTSALKGDSQQRGAWGEAQLKRTLEMSGLIEDAHYEVQSSFKDLDGKQKQTDYLIKLPDNKHIIIDSKVSLVDYDRAISADSPEAQALTMEDHVKSVKRHIDDLAKKDYTNLIGMRSPSFVLMFMPIEPAYIDALKTNKDLFAYGYAKGIVLVSHTTLIPILRTVANLWMMEKSNAEAREISEKAGDIYNQVCLVAERLQKLGGTLGTVSNHYNATVKALVGQQGLHGKVERFSQLSSKVSKSMPAVEATHLDFETEKLALAAEPISEAVEEKSPEREGQQALIDG